MLLGPLFGGLYVVKHIFASFSEGGFGATCSQMKKIVYLCTKELFREYMT
jgi:hypothetical protein